MIDPQFGGDIKITSEGQWKTLKLVGDVANLQQPSCDDSPLYSYKISLSPQLLLVTKSSSKLATAAV